MRGPPLRQIALGLVLAGALVELLAVVHLTPVTFVLFAFVGVPLTLAGMVIFCARVWYVLRDRGVV